MEKNRFATMGKVLSHPQLFVWCSVWLMVLVVLGTLKQGEIGLYAAQERYFSSWLLWLGIIPTPGGRLTLTVIFINLCAYLWVRARKSWRQSGLLVAHLGGLLLLAGGFLTAYFSVEGRMIIPEGESESMLLHDHRVELAVIDHTDPEHDQVIAFRSTLWQNDAPLTHEALPFSMHIVRYARQARITSREVPDDAFRGAGRQMTFVPLNPGEAGDQSHHAMELEIHGAGEDADGRYLLVENMRTPARFRVGKRTFSLNLRPVHIPLPFSIELVDFQKEMHPGTQMARSYQSEVIVSDQGQERRALIEMNRPLRYRGYTFYQSSYIEGSERDTTVLAVVKNYGRQFPYISSVIMCIGLLIHMVLHLPMLFPRPAAKEGSSS